MVHELLLETGVDKDHFIDGDTPVYTPIDGNEIACVHSEIQHQSNAKVSASKAAFEQWRLFQAPARGDLVRLFGLQLRQHKEALGKLISVECGKIQEEGLGEVQ